MFMFLFWYGGWGFAVPRIVLGVLLIIHGWAKVRDLKQNAKKLSWYGI